MNCYVCDGPQVLIWGGDHDLEEDEDHEYVTNLSYLDHLEQEKQQLF